MSEEIKLGAELEGWCTKCREMTLHNVLSLPVDKKPARVRCKVCNGDHNFRPNPPQSRRSSKAGTGPRRKAGTEITEEQKAAAKPYQIGGVYRAGDVISHPSFGFGEVREIRSEQRMIVEFGPTVKQLVFNTRVP